MNVQASQIVNSPQVTNNTSTGSAVVVSNYSPETLEQINKIKQGIVPFNSFASQDSPDYNIDANFVNQWVQNKGAAPTSTDMAWLLLVKEFGEQEAGKLQKTSTEENGYKVESFFGPDGEAYKLYIKADDSGNFKESFLVNQAENTKTVMTYDTKYGNQGAGLGREYTDGDGVRRAEWNSAGETLYSTLDTKTGAAPVITTEKPETFEIDTGFVNEWAEDLGRDVKSEDLGYLLLLDVLESEEDVRNLQTIVEYEGDQKITKFMAASGEKYELRTTENTPNSGVASASLKNLENGSKAVLTFDNNQALGAGYGTEYSLGNSRYRTWASAGEKLFNSPDLDLNPYQLSQGDLGNCTTLATLSALSLDDDFRENVLEKSIVKQADGDYKVYLAGGKDYLNYTGQSLSPGDDGFGIDNRGLYVNVSKADMDQNSDLVNRAADKDYLVLSTAVEKLAESYGQPGFETTKNGLGPLGQGMVMSLFTGEESKLALEGKFKIAAPDSMDTFFKNSQNIRGTITFGDMASPTVLGNGFEQQIVGNHTYALLSDGEDSYKLINPWSTNTAMSLSKEKLSEIIDTADVATIAYQNANQALG